MHPSSATFQSTLPARGATKLRAVRTVARKYFNPRSPHGERPTRRRNESVCRMHFNPRSPHGERLEAVFVAIDTLKFQSTLPARGATRHSSIPNQSRSPFQSTLPARGATAQALQFIGRKYSISIHAPRTGSDASALRAFRCLPAFQSTLPARGATPNSDATACHAPISIHAPRTGSDRWRVGSMFRKKLFQSTLPARGATHIFIICH